MSGTETTRAILATDGRVLVEQPDGSYRPVEGHTDWARVDRTSEAEATAPLVDEPQSQGDDPAFWEHARLVYPVPKERITMRLDADMLAWFRRQGRGYQTRINAILRGYYEHARGKAGP